MLTQQNRQPAHNIKKRTLRFEAIIVFILIILGIALLSNYTFVLGPWITILWMHWLVIVLAFAFIGVSLTIWLLTSSKDSQQAIGSIRPGLRAVFVNVGIACITATTIILLLSDLNIVQGPVGPVISTLFTAFGLLFAIFSLPIFTSVSTVDSQRLRQENTAINLDNSAETQHLSSHPSPTDKAHSIQGIPPSTHVKTIQPREKVVDEIYTKLTQSNITAIALTGNTDTGKSTLAALIFQYAEMERQANRGFFRTEGLWFTVSPTTTLSDVIYTLFDAQGRSMPDLPPHNQKTLLLDVLNMPDKRRFIVLDQFENWLDKETGLALPDNIAVDELLDAINSKLCTSRILLTAYPSLTRNCTYAPAHLQEYEVKGLELDEGIRFMEGLGVARSSADLRKVVEHYGCYPYTVALAADYLKVNPGLSISHFLHDFPRHRQLYDSYIDRTIKNLNKAELNLLLAFSVYRKAVPLKAAQAIFSFKISEQEVRFAHQTLLEQRLLQAIERDNCQLYPAVANYLAANRDKTIHVSLKNAHIKAAKYYLEQAEREYLPASKRTEGGDIQLLIEAVWHLCQAKQFQKAYELAQQEAIFPSLKKSNDTKTLLELCDLFLSSDSWQPTSKQTMLIHQYEEWVYTEKEKGH